MRSMITTFVLAAGLCGIPMVTGCDKEVAKEERTVTTPSGTKHEETTVKQNSDGTVTKTEEMKKTDH